MPDPYLRPPAEPERVDEPLWLCTAVLLGVILAAFALLWLVAP